MEAVFIICLFPNPIISAVVAGLIKRWCKLSYTSLVGFYDLVLYYLSLFLVYRGAKILSKAFSGGEVGSFFGMIDLLPGLAIVLWVAASIGLLVLLYSILSTLLYLFLFETKEETFRVSLFQRAKLQRAYMHGLPFILTWISLGLLTPFIPYARLLELLWRLKN
jgi:hypothetical protein